MEEVKTEVVTEPVKTVSNEQPKQDPTPEDKSLEKVEEFKMPTTKEEVDALIKSAVSREKTNFLKELGVKSVKEYKEQISKSEEALSKHEELTKRNEELTKTYDSLSKEFETVKQTSILDRLGVKEEYREDLTKIAKDKVDDKNSFEDVLKSLVDSKYQYAVNKGIVKMGVEKTKSDKDTTTVSPELTKKYPWLK